MASPPPCMWESASPFSSPQLTLCKPWKNQGLLTHLTYTGWMQQGLIFINSLYTESLDLMVEARNYFQYSDSNRRAINSGTPRDRLFVNYQALRLTSRMTQAMAWLLAQRALQDGELSPHEACNGTYSLGAERICTDREGHKDGRLPQPMQHLLDRSHSLYMRVLRLDMAAREKFSTAGI